MQMESVGRGRVNVTEYRGWTTGVGGLILGDLPFSSFLLYFKACPAAWRAWLVSAAPRTLSTCGHGWLGYLRRWASSTGCIIYSFAHQQSHTDQREWKSISLWRSPHLSLQFPRVNCTLGLPARSLPSPSSPSWLYLSRPLLRNPSARINPGTSCI